MTNILPMISAASYRAARDAAWRAIPVLDAKGYIEDSLSLSRRAERYDQLGFEKPSATRQAEFEYRVKRWQESKRR